MDDDVVVVQDSVVVVDVVVVVDDVGVGVPPGLSP
jgi:hypothetical protein